MGSGRVGVESEERNRERMGENEGGGGCSVVEHKV